MRYICELVGNAVARCLSIRGLFSLMLLASGTLARSQTVPPTITGITAYQATVGKSITITGSNFGDGRGNGWIQLMGSGVPDVYIVSEISSWSSTAITFTLPEYASAASYQVRVLTAANEFSAPKAQLD